ncbi:ISAs1 family transposase [Photobacterium phosphoreum]|uniref:ISAs1 family transposase n=1 Tax=Photobacterium phosphoreum TaxID=659 RepID=UPI000D175497|nr:ISAs1 family transposase [Photobacterium phosphoreum]PSW23121.1 ISAs1 family transposase [Photobacterium phosphoreum]
MHIDHFKEHFESITDQRQGAKVTYCLFEVLFGSLCAVIAGAKGWFDIREYILGHHDWFAHNNMFLNDIPADDTIARIISTIEPKPFQECFINWMSSVHTLTEGQVVAIDGKTLRGSYNREDRSSTIHMISAYASSNKLVLGQLKTEQKSNEITAIPELIKMLDIKGALVTIDAMACQTKIAKAIVDKGADYLLAVKSNQGKLRIAVEKAFAAERASVANNITFEKGHGRIESRQCHVCGSDKLEGNFSRWKDLKSIIMVEKFHFIKGKKLDLEYRYYISSKELTAEQAASAIREHWGIESMHWVLDVSMNEDACQIYKDHGAENLACLRHMGLNMLRAEPTKLSVVGKQKRCMMNTSMLEAVLSAGFIAMAKN